MNTWKLPEKFADNKVPTLNEIPIRVPKLATKTRPN